MIPPGVRGPSDPESVPYPLNPGAVMLCIVDGNDVEPDRAISEATVSRQEHRGGARYFRLLALVDGECRRRETSG